MQRQLVQAGLIEDTPPFQTFEKGVLECYRRITNSVGPLRANIIATWPRGNMDIRVVNAGRGRKKVEFESLDKRTFYRNLQACARMGGIAPIQLRHFTEAMFEAPSGCSGCGRNCQCGRSHAVMPKKVVAGLIYLPNVGYYKQNAAMTEEAQNTGPDGAPIAPEPLVEFM